MVSGFQLALTLLLLQLPSTGTVRPEADDSTLEVHANGALVRLKQQQNMADPAANGSKSGASSDEKAAGASSDGKAAGASDGKPAGASDGKADGNATGNLLDNGPALKDMFTGRVTGKVEGGVSKNRKGDFNAWLSAMTTSTAVILIAFTVFNLARLRWHHFPVVFANNTVNGQIPPELKPNFDTMSGWATSVDEMTRDDTEAACGLDQTFMIETFKIYVKMVGTMCVVFCSVFLPLHYVFGNANVPCQCELGRMGMQHLENGNWVFWVHGAAVWFMIFMVMEIMMSYHGDFLQRRSHWLQAMPVPRATTVLVEEVPRQLRSDVSMHQYFSSIFGQDAIVSACMVKDTKFLLALQEDWHMLHQKKMEAESTWEAAENKPEDRPTCSSRDGTNGRGFRKVDVPKQTVDMINHYTTLTAECLQQIRDEQLRIRTEAEAEGKEMTAPAGVLDNVKSGTFMRESLGTAPRSVCTHAGFVTFKTRRDAAVAKLVNCKQDMGELVTGPAPEPTDIRYEDFMVDKEHRYLWEALGYFLIMFMFLSFLPIVILVQSLSNIDEWRLLIPILDTLCDQYPIIECFIEGLLSTLGLKFVMSWIPTVLIAIFGLCFTLRAHAWSQVSIQVWYFWFQVVYVVLLTAVGSSLFDTVWTIAHKPFELPKLLATTIPTATHFYLSYTSVLWSTRALEMLRLVQVSKFLTFRAIYKDAEKARELSEPEDQDYYGIGSRNARTGVQIVIAMIYGPLCPWILPVCLVDALILRYTASYLIIFAETRKPDLGGVFWVQMVKQIFFGLFLYITLMFGILHSRGPNVDGITWLTPGTMILPAGVILLSRYRNFLALQWYNLPFEDGIKEEKDITVPIRKPTRDTYEQPELLEQTFLEGLSGAASSSATFSTGSVPGDAK